MAPIAVQALQALLKARVIVERQVAGVWLFGSALHGEHRPDSDVDFAVLCDPPLALQRTAVMDEVGLAIGSDVDVIDLTTAAPALAWEILTTGKLVFEGDELEVERFMRAARYAAEDDEQRSRMVLLGQMTRAQGQRL